MSEVKESTLSRGKLNCYIFILLYNKLLNVSVLLSLNREDRDDTCITLGRTSKIRWMTSSLDSL